MRLRLSRRGILLRNINFYTVYKLGSEQYGGLDWRAWIAGVEYVQGKPMLFALIHFQWEP